MLSVSMIARDEEAYVADAIRSILPIAGEVILIDTGSTDKTREIAASLGATIFSYAWNDDFAEARNFGLSKCKGDWVLVLDCDERISVNDHELLSSLMQHSPAAYELTQRHYCNDPSVRGFIPCSGENPEFELHYAGYVETSCVRLFPLHSSIRFHGRVHELVEPSLGTIPELAIVSCDIRLHHYGNVRPEREQRKAALYSTLSASKAAEPKAGWKDFFELGIEHKIGGRLQESARALHKSLLLNPDHFNTFINLGFVLTELGRYESAEQVLRTALARNEFAADVHNNLGVLYLRCKRFLEARFHLEQARELHPWDVNALCNLGKVCLITGDLACAEKSYREALELIEDHAPALLELGALYLKQKMDALGLEYLQKAAKAAPKESRVHYHLGMAYRAVNKSVEALHELETFCALERELLLRDPNPTIQALVQAVEKECLALRAGGKPA